MSGSAWVLDAERLGRVYRTAKGKRAKDLAAALEPFMRGLGVDIQGAAALLGTIGVESLELQILRELWGPTDAQRRYERPRPGGVPEPLCTGPRSAWPLWQRLGNTEKGDSFLFRGRGPGQMTGRDAHTRASAALGIDLVKHPEQLEVLEVGLRAMTWQWREKVLVAEPDFRRITKAWNGGYTDMDKRLDYYNRALAALKVTT